MIKIDYKYPNFVLSFPFNKSDLLTVKNLPVRNYRKEDHAWFVPGLAVKTIEHLKVCWTPVALNAVKYINKNLLDLVDIKFTGSKNEVLLRGYQRVGVEFLKTAKKCLLADDMGLGKSLQLITVMVELGFKKNLIICPSSLKYNWENEFKKHFNIQPIVIDGNKKKRAELWAADNSFIICSYDILRFDWSIIPKIWDVIGADEIVFLKSRQAVRSKLAKRLQSNIRIGLSGFPLENNLEEFYSIMEWIRPDILPTFGRFRSRYVQYDWSGLPVSWKNIDELHLLTSPFILRRTKEGVLQELPDKVYVEYPLSLTTSMEKIYSSICKEFLIYLRSESDREWNSLDPLVKLIRIRQFVEFPDILGFKTDNIKLDWLKEVYEYTPKLVVFSCFAETVKRLADEFNTGYVIMGDVVSKNRFDIVEHFNKIDRGMLVSTDAGRFGLNITGASNIVHFGSFFNPATMMQREDRLHRIGQKNSVTVLSPFYMDTIDQGIREIFLKRKNDVIDFLDGSDKMSRSKLSSIDFKNLIF